MDYTLMGYHLTTIKQTSHAFILNTPQMSFLNLKRLLPPKKVWKIFTNKLQIIKTHKLNRSRAIQKPPKMQSYKSNFKKLRWPILSIECKKFKIKPKLHTLIHLNKLTPPVYVDRLYVGSLSTVKQHAPAAFTKEVNNKKSSFYKKNYHKSKEANDMSESMVLTSPQSSTRGINERADEFIAKFRAQMHHQEMQARRL